MEHVEVPEFAIAVEPSQPADATERRSKEHTVLGFRERLEYFYAAFKRLERTAATREAEFQRRDNKFFLDVIRVADSFEDVFRMCDEDKKLRKHKAVVEFFQVTYETLIRVLEDWGVYQVPIKGKGYEEVQFQGVPIPEPWEVVGASPEAKKSKKKAV